MRATLRTCVRALLTTGLAAGILAIPAASVAAEATPPFIPASASWLDTVNYYRAMAGVAPIAENATLSSGAYNHSCYMLQNGIGHDEVPGYPGYTASGDDAGNNGNVAVSSVYGQTARSHVELWMTGPFHAIGVLRHNLARAGFGKCDSTSTSPWKSGATFTWGSGANLGIDWGRARPGTPILFPGNGTTTNLDRFVTESPNPLTYCGWPSGGGLPLIAMMPEGVSAATGAITGPSGPLQVCTLHPGNLPAGLARDILASENAVVVMARDRLPAGTYSATVTTQARTVSWSFTVDPAAADGTPAPPPDTYVTGGVSGFSPVTPFRLVDTRSGLGATRLQANVPARIVAGGVGGIPAGSTAVSANFTIVTPNGAGYLTAYPCGSVPLVSTVNYSAGETVPNAAIVPLDASGGLCVLSTSSADLVIDVNGAFSAAGPGRLTPTTPTRVFDTRSGLRAPGRLTAGQVLRVDMNDDGTGVPADATAVVLNLTAHRSSALSFVTAFPCDQSQPVASNLNPKAGETRPNQVIVPLAADGSVCFYSASDADLFADLAGYVRPASGARFTPLAPTRITDTRDRYRTALNAGTNGNPVPAGGVLQIPMAGVRGIPAGATAVSVNVTTTDTLGDGYVTAYPCGTAPPFASTVNLRPWVAIPNAAQVKLSSTGSLCVYVTHSVHVIVDINGIWS
jgi:hypothetical protein